MTLTPYIVTKDAKAAMEFYTEAFGAREIFRLTDPGDGRIGHAEMEIGGALLMLADEYPDFGALAPETIGGTPVTLLLALDDVDATVVRAEAAGALVLRVPADQSFGERTATLMDPFGHRWMLAQRIEEVAPEEMQRRWENETGA